MNRVPSAVPGSRQRLDRSRGISYVARMPNARAFAIAGLVLLLVPARAGTQPLLPLQKKESHVDKNGCIHFAATAVVDAPVEDLFDALSTPESRGARRSIVFILARRTRSPVKGTRMIKLPPGGTWAINSPPEAMIVGTYSLMGLMWGPLGAPMTWVEYHFDRQHRTIYERTIGGSSGFLTSPTCVPPNRAQYALSSAERGSATLVRYTKLGCWSPGLRKQSPTFDQQQIESFTRSLSARLAVAQHYAQLIAREHPKLAGPAKTSSQPVRSVVTQTPTPVVTVPRP